VTVSEKYRTLVSATTTVQLATPTALTIAFAGTDPTTGVFDIQVVNNAGTATDIAANASNRVNFSLVLSRDV
jgi:hypothetical protein